MQPQHTTLRRSEHLQVVRSASGEAVIWHSLFGNPQIVSDDTLMVIDYFETPHTLDECVAYFELDSKSRDGLSGLSDNYVLVPVDFDERSFLKGKMQERDEVITSGSMVEFLELIMSEACNFRCTYCIHFNNLETADRLKQPKKFMTFEVAKKTVDEFLTILRSNGKTYAVINFGGGEPLLAWDVIHQVLDYCRSVYGEEFTLRFCINTNAALITAEIAKVLKEFGVEIASSLDGLREGNDAVRLTQSGGGTFDLITKGYDTLAGAGYPLDGIAVTVNERNFPFLDEGVIDWAAQRGMVEVRIDIDVIDMVEIPVEDIVERLMRVRRYAAERNIDVAGFWSRPAENLNESTLNQHIAFCGAVRGNSMCVSPSGNIYGCGYSNTQLGELTTISSFSEEGGRYHRFVRDHLTGTMEMCRGCMIEGQCAGGCNITQEFARATHTDKIDRMCEFYRMMTRELVLEQLASAS